MISFERNQVIENYFYNEDIDWKSIVSDLINSEEIHNSLSFYNWDDGFEYPTFIIQRPDCDFGTLRLMFDLIEMDPFRQVELDEIKKYPTDFQCFYSLLCTRLNSGDFPKEIKYGNELTKRQVYILKKEGVEPDLYAPTPGTEVVIKRKS